MKKVVSIFLVVLALLNPIGFARPLETKALTQIPDPPEDVNPDSIYYFNNPYIWEDEIHNWGSGDLEPYGYPQVLEENQQVRIYIYWSTGAYFKIGFTDEDTNERCEMVFPSWGVNDLYAPYDGTFWIRIDNTYDGSSFTYDGYYIIY